MRVTRKAVYVFSWAILSVLIHPLLAQPAASRYTYFSGTIGTVPVIMHLHQYGNKVSGYYYYQKQQQPIPCIGTVSKDSLRLTAWLGSAIDEAFDGTWKAGQFQGKWTNNAKQSGLTFNLQASAAKSDQFVYIYTEGSKKLIENKGKTEVPAADYLEGTIWPTERMAAGQEALTGVIRKKLKIPDGATPGNVFLQRRKAYLAAYVKENAGVSQKEMLESVGQYSQSSQSNLQLVYWSDQYAVLALSSYEYTGGAHGNYGTDYTTVDLKTGKVVSLADILTPVGRQKLPALLAANFRKQYAVKPSETLQQAGLFDNSIKPNGNFYVTGTTLTFCYTPYEIGPYAMGEIQIPIPLSQLAGGLVKP